MGRSRRPVFLLVVMALALFPRLAAAQTGSIAGVVRDEQGGALQGVLVEVTSPQLIEKVRSTTTDQNGRYQIVRLPVGTYKVSFKLDAFATVERANVELTSDFSAPVNAEMRIGTAKEVVTVEGSSVAIVDVQNARQRQVFQREELTELPITRNLNSLVQLVPGIAINAANAGTSQPQICSGGQADAGGFPNINAAGPMSGCGPLVNGFNAHSSINDTESNNQGRFQVDGMGVQSYLGGGRSSYVADISNAQEVTFTLSGSLGESETGGTTINIIPRTGGNRFAGNFFTGYSGARFFGKNTGSRPSTFSNRLVSEYDVNGAYGGPILRDRLWFYGAARRQARENLLTAGFRNLNEGLFGVNYKWDPNAQLNQGDIYQNANMRLTLQASQRDKFNIFWDEQYTCENPCWGAGPAISPEASASQLRWPLHVAQLSWTNPLTSKILLEAGISHYGEHRDATRNRDENAYPQLPRLNEIGNRTLVSPTTSVTTNIASGSISTGGVSQGERANIDNIQSRASASYVTGSHNIKLGYQGAYLSRISDPYYNDLKLMYNYTSPVVPSLCTTPSCITAGNAVANGTATGNAARFEIAPAPTGGFGVVNGCYFNANTPKFDNVVPVSITTTTGAPGAAREWCGSIAIPGNPGGLNDPSNSALLTRPTSVTQYISAKTDEKAWYAGFYLQDQWTLNRFTFSGALRYDNAQSRFKKTCVGPDLYLPSDLSYCLNDPDDPLNGGGTGKGVYYQDITPRWGVTWDVFGNGKTALKYSQGKYLNGVSATGIYVAANPASGGRTINSHTREWRDWDGDRIVDCDLTVPAAVPSTATGIPANGECGGPASGQPFGVPNTTVTDSRRFGRSPNQLDEAGLAVGLGTLYCGQDERSMSNFTRTYCNNYLAAGGKNLMSGWGVRQYEWQMSLGIQHELLPRLSAEVTYNRRSQGNQTITDLIGSGCDLYASDANPVNPDQCMDDLLNFKSPYYDFYGVVAPVDQRLPGGGGYTVAGIATAKQTCTTVGANGACTQVGYVTPPAGQGVNAITLAGDRRHDYWSGVDTNFVLRARGGLRVSGGTSTGRRVDNTCRLLVNDPPGGQVIEVGGERTCEAVRPFQTNLRGTASYTVPWVDVLVSSTFSYRPGVEYNATYTAPFGNLVWLSDRIDPNAIQNNTTGTVSRDLLFNDFYGEGIRQFDLRLAKNIRFAGKRINIGADVFNMFNSDAATAYCGNFPNLDQGGSVFGCGTAAAPQQWREVTNIVTPRYARFQVQFDF